MSAKAPSAGCVIPVHYSSSLRLLGIAVLCAVFGHAIGMVAPHIAHDTSLINYSMASWASAYLALAAGIYTKGHLLDNGRDYTSEQKDFLVLLSPMRDPVRRTIWSTTAFAVVFISTWVEIEGYTQSSDHMKSYWYIPAILALVVLHPLHLRFGQMPQAVKLILVGMTVLLSISVQGDQGLTPQGPASAILLAVTMFWLGLSGGLYWHYVRGFISSLARPLLIGWVVMTMLAIAVADRTYAPEILFNGPLLISIAQKTFGLFFLLALLERYRTQRLPAIDWLGKHSAMIFLLHPLIIGALLLSPYISGIFIPELFVSMAIVALTARKFGYTVGRYMREPKQTC